MANTTIQISSELLEELKKRKLHSKESYEEVIWDALEDALEVNAETKKEIAVARAQYRKGNVKSLDQVKKELGV